MLSWRITHKLILFRRIFMSQVPSQYDWTTPTICYRRRKWNLFSAVKSCLSLSMVVIQLLLLRWQRFGEVVQQATDPDHESWFCIDQLVKSWIFRTFSEEALGSVWALWTAKEVWSTSLANTYNWSSISREFDIKRKLQLLTKQGKSCSVYAREYASIYR